MAAAYKPREEAWEWKLSCWHLYLGLLSLQNCENMNFWCLSHPVYSILLRQTEKTKTDFLPFPQKYQAYPYLRVLHFVFCLKHSLPDCYMVAPIHWLNATFTERPFWIIQSKAAISSSCSYTILFSQQRFVFETVLFIFLLVNYSSTPLNLNSMSGGTVSTLFTVASLAFRTMPSM